MYQSDLSSAFLYEWKHSLGDSRHTGAKSLSWKKSVHFIRNDELDLRKTVSDPNSIYFIHPCKSNLILFLQYGYKSLKNALSKQQLISRPYSQNTITTHPHPKHSTPSSPCCPAQPPPCQQQQHTSLPTFLYFPEDLCASCRSQHPHIYQQYQNSSLLSSSFF